MPLRERGIPSVQQIEDKTHDFNAYYHKAGDTVEHMDADYWQAMMRGLVATIATWAELEPQTPPTAEPTATPLPPPATPGPSVTPEPPAPRLLLPLLYREAGLPGGASGALPGSPTTASLPPA